MRKLFERQVYHLVAYVLIGGLLVTIAEWLPESGLRAWGHSAREWTLVSWLFAGAMQAWIWFFWRTELYFRGISRVLGRFGFPLFQVGFVLMPIGRFLPLVPISIATVGTSPLPRSVSLAFLVVSAPAILWTFYSFAVYLGVRRAMGADHFDVATYRGGKLETRGVFRYVRNPAYSLGLLLLYHAGLLWGSTLALLVAAAHHAFVWVAYFCTEKPDMREIYGSAKSEE